MKQSEITIQVRVRYPECDPMGYVHHSRYFIYFELARMELYRANGGDYRDMCDAGHFFVVVSSECRYRKPAKFDDEIHVTCRVAKVTRAKIVHEYRVARGDETLTEAKITLAMINRDGNVVLIPDEFMI